MCGIAGVLSGAPLADPAALGDRLDRALAHRGPDGRGRHVSSDGRLLLVHRRLSIIDPHPRAGQPMASPDARYQLVFNGEIYNHRALRAGLEASGETFETASDTEVLLRLLVRRGPAALAEARGMFALGLWDEGERTLLLARDGFGIKPLYLAAEPGRVVFASEVGALWRSGLVDRRADAAGVLAFLRWGSIPSPLTWVAGVESLPPGTWRRWSADGPRDGGRFTDVRRIWTVPEGDGRIPPETLPARVRTALDESVSAHLTADVPVGVFLSGGLDSTALASAARARATELHTYTVAFDDDAASEEAAARATAARLGTVHHTLRVEAADVGRDWPGLLASLDQPSADGVNAYYVARAVAATGLKAVISGVGGDEVFGGYPAFRRLPRALRVARVCGPALPLAGRVAALGRPASQATRWRHFGRSRGSTGEVYRALRGFLMPAELDALAGPAVSTRDACDRVVAAEAELFMAAGPETPEAATARLESTVYMRSQLLRDLDAMSMAHALEVRVPFVDRDLVGAVWPAVAAHPELLRRKRLLADVVGGPAAAAIAARPKQGFTLPFERWIDAPPLRDLVHAGLTVLSRDGWLAPGAADALGGAWRAGALHWTRMWGLGVLGHFLGRP